MIRFYILMWVSNTINSPNCRRESFVTQLLIVILISILDNINYNRYIINIIWGKSEIKCQENNVIKNLDNSDVELVGSRVDCLELVGSGVDCLELVGSGVDWSGGSKEVRQDNIKRINNNGLILSSRSLPNNMIGKTKFITEFRRGMVNISTNNLMDSRKQVGFEEDRRLDMDKRSNVKAGGGYVSYFKNYESLGNIVDVLNNDNRVIEIFNSKVISRLEDGKIYRILVMIKYIEDGEMKGRTPSYSMQINKNISVFLLIERIKNELRRFEMEYNLQDYYGEVFVGWKEWLTEEEYNKNLSQKEVDKILNDVLIEDKKTIKNVKNELIEGKVFDYINDKLPKMISIEELKTIDQVDSRRKIASIGGGVELVEDPNLNIIRKEIIEYITEFNKGRNGNLAKFGVKENVGVSNRKDIELNPNFYKIKNVYLLNYNGVDVLLFVYKENVNKKITEQVYFIVDFDSWKNIIFEWNLKRSSFIKWTDRLELGNINFQRIIKPYVLYINRMNGKLNYLERFYDFADMILPYKEKEFYENYGSLDLETMIVNDNIEDNTDNNREDNKDSSGGGNSGLNEEELNKINIEDLGLGRQVVYAGGWKIRSEGSIKSQNFIIDNDKINNSEDLIDIMFKELFEVVENKCKIWVHNLGRFDAIFLIKYLIKLNYEVNPIWKDNKVLKIKIYNPKSKKTIILLDSMNFFSISLRKLLDTFKCDIRKGEFPHLFVNNYILDGREYNNLNYIGNKPDIKYYNLTKISKKDYDEIPISNWSLKDECLKYLTADVDGLFEIMDKTSKYYFANYRLNMSNYLTLPSLAIAIFGSNFFNNEKYRLKMVKGPIEKYIRNSYYGGNVLCNVNNDGIVGKGYVYDINSQYPEAMKAGTMPVGNPVFSTNKDLNYYSDSGFLLAKIIPPSKDILENLFIQYRDLKTTVNTCPRTPFTRWIDITELKQGIKYGYTAEIECGINFPDSKKVDSENLFTEFVDHFFEKKLNASDGVEKTIAKLTLNSLYGKFGQKDITSRIKVVDRETANKLIKKHHYTYFAEIGEDKILIKYSERLNEKLRKLYKEDDDEKDQKFFSKTRGVVSAVQFSSRIAALARIKINEFKNLKDYILYYSDTDSLVLNKPLDPKFIGKGLGQWKEEAEIMEGVFIGPKKYCYIDKNGNSKKVCAGVKASELSLDQFKEIAAGGEIIVNMPKITVDWKKLEIRNVLQKITISKTKKQQI